MNSICMGNAAPENIKSSQEQITAVCQDLVIAAYL